MTKDKLMIIDGSSLLYRAFYALPLLTTKDGIYTNGAYGFLTMLYNLQDQYQPDYICVAFDKSGPTFRHKEYEEYKGTRQETPSELAGQFSIIRDILKSMNIVTLEMSEYEADDIAGTLARQGEEKGLEVILVTGDKDYLQLATEKSKVLLTRKGISDMEEFDRETILEEYGLEPKQLIDVKGLMGDKSDNIPGVPGIGEKTGLKLIKEFGSIEEVYKNLDKVSGKKLKENLIENENIAYLSRKLGEIITNIPLDLGIEDLKVKDANWEELLPLFEKLEFKSFINRAPDKYRNKEDEIEINYEYKIVSAEEIEEVAKSLSQEKKLAFKFLIDGSNIIEDEIISLGIKPQTGSTYYIDLSNMGERFIQLFKPIFENPQIEKIGHSLKKDMAILFRYGIQIQNYGFDSMIAQYLIDPSQSDYSINKLSEEYLGAYGTDEEMLLGKGKGKKTFSQLSEEDMASHLSFTLETVFALEGKMIEKIREYDMEDLYYNVELPLTEVLSSMEYLGFKVDEDQLKMLGEQFDAEIKSLTEEIHQLGGGEFNINSPKQIGEILFDRLNLPVIKKTKTGYSTSVEVLEKLKDKHPIIEKILRYRQIVKLKSTYIDGLTALINRKTGRIHSSFNQTITSTGRISSTEPNLQNIPIRTEDGRRIRKAFVAEKPDYTLVDADYSQIELRVLAHISQDEKMMEAFIKDQDIHTKTASEVFHLPMEEVTPSIRNNAKAVNFGIVYGISDYGLSQDLNITRKEAKDFIDKYLDNYTGVRQFMEDIVVEGKEKGYVETLLHRRRYIPELKSKNFNVRSFGERIAMNTPIQGSAADIIKVAMVKVYKALREKGLKSRLILQVHDELIIETHMDELDEVKTILKEIMEGSISLSIPLRVDIEIGDSWYETH
ncbi:MAG: DNA polymerase I [Tissierellia bacterium]|jgi:DNA polymerase-1|nr:DNA polymerase I [Tissierellia bacterium]